jgi:hypothetical protein
MLHLFPHWNWSGQEDRPIDVWCYSNCDSVELFFNDRSLGVGRRNNGAEHFSWQVPYQPGTLAARAMQGGKVVCFREIRTAGAPAKIVLTQVMAALVGNQQITPLQADGRDVALVQAAVVDQNGVVVPDATNMIQFSIEGNEKIIGVGNGDMASHEPNQVSYRKAYNGYSVAIVQSTTQPHAFTVVATSPTLASGRMELASVTPAVQRIHVHAKSIRPSDNGEIVVTAELCDSYGNRIPTAKALVNFSLNGAAYSAIMAEQGKAEARIICQHSGVRMRVTADSPGVLAGVVDFVTSK